LTACTTRLPLPVYALGGVTRETATQLNQSGVAGLAAIEGLIMDIRKENTTRGHRFVMDTDQGEAEMTLVRVGDGVFNASHTFVPKALEGCDEIQAETGGGRGDWRLKEPSVSSRLIWLRCTARDARQ